MTTTPSLNAEGVDPIALAGEIEQWLARTGTTASRLAEHAGIDPRGIWQLRNFKRPHVTLDWADRLTLAMDVPLAVVAPPTNEEPEARATRLGKKLDRHMNAESIAQAGRRSLPGEAVHGVGAAGVSDGRSSSLGDVA